MANYINTIVIMILSFGIFIYIWANYRREKKKRFEERKNRIKFINAKIEKELAIEYTRHNDTEFTRIVEFISIHEKCSKCSYDSKYLIKRENIVMFRLEIYCPNGNCSVTDITVGMIPNKYIEKLGLKTKR